MEGGLITFSGTNAGVDMISFCVPGEPVPKGRARTRVVTTKAGKSFAAHYTPGETRAFEERVALVCRAAVARTRWTWGPKDRFSVTVRIYRTHEGRGGDLDNLVKATFDAINRIAFADDRYIREMRATLSQDAKSPRVEIEVRRMRVGEVQ